MTERWWSRLGFSLETEKIDFEVNDLQDFRVNDHRILTDLDLVGNDLTVGEFQGLTYGNGLKIANKEITLSSASLFGPGAVSTEDQIWAGHKHFRDGLEIYETTSYDIGGSKFIHNLPVNSMNTFCGLDAGLNNTGGSNIGIGHNALMNSVGSAGCIAIGNGALANTTSSNNIAIGNQSLLSATVDVTNNIAIGGKSMGGNTTGPASVITNSVAVGFNALSKISSGTSNIGIGYNALVNVASGSGNIGIGGIAGAFYTGGESSNICIGHGGVVGDDSILRIGNLIAKTFISGIHNRTPAGSDIRMVTIDENGQLGTQALPP